MLRDCSSYPTPMEMWNGSATLESSLAGPQKVKHTRSVPEGIQPYNMKQRHLLKKIQDTRNLVHRTWHLSPLQSRYLGTSHSSPSVSSTVQNTLQNLLLESPSAAPSYFPESHLWSEISFLSEVISVLGKARSHRAPNLGRRRAESPGWFDVLPDNSAQDMMCEWARCHDEAAHHQLPIAAAFWII